MKIFKKTITAVLLILILLILTLYIYMNYNEVYEFETNLSKRAFLKKNGMVISNSGFESSTNKYEVRKFPFMNTLIVTSFLPDGVIFDTSRFDYIDKKIILRDGALDLGTIDFGTVDLGIVVYKMFNPHFVYWQCNLSDKEPCMSYFSDIPAEGVERNIENMNINEVYNKNFRGEVTLDKDKVFNNENKNEIKVPKGIYNVDSKINYKFTKYFGDDGWEKYSHTQTTEAEYKNITNMDLYYFVIETDSTATIRRSEPDFINKYIGFLLP